MSNDSQKNDAVRVCRKPRAAMTQGRKRMPRPVRDSSMLVRRQQIVINRPVNDMKANSAVKAETEVAPSRAKEEQVRMNRIQASAMPVMASRIKRIAKEDDAQSPKRSAREMKEEAIQKAMMATKKKSFSNKAKKKGVHVRFGFKRVLLATVCAAVAVFAIVYFVNLNAPNISLKVAAMQSGIDASYPAYVPRDFNLSDITSENGKITLNFKNSSTGDAFTLMEEKSSWDSNALLNNYVSEEYSDNYTLIREQGLALYVSGSDAAWVNGGVVYKLKTTSGTLTKKQIKAIAVSL